MFIHFFCLCPLSLTMKLNFNISKEVYLRTLCNMSHGQNIPRHVPATCHFSMHHTSFFVAPTWPIKPDHLKYRVFPEGIFIFILNSMSHSKIEEKNAFPVGTRCCSVKKKKFEASVFKVIYHWKMTNWYLEGGVFQYCKGETMILENKHPT